MHIKDGFRLRTICGESIIVAEGENRIDFNKIVSLNESAAYLWSSVGEKEFTADDLAALLTNRYEVAADVAAADAARVAESWVAAGLAE
ncbi:MAG: PqqD family peptide modification chaperone [Bacteroidales bacterium]|nr:PqqD family peptide modification chaperone [Bacteroidales bacterium]